MTGCERTPLNRWQSSSAKRCSKSSVCSFVPRSQFVDTLDLNDVEYKEILNYFIFHRNDSEESLVEWLYDWISTNRYELPKEFSIRMAHKYHESVTEVFGDE
ncbi:ketol-acid reductoisomerase [Streptococcus pneumoniae]|nr:ketol-acid reductoisomerase [Streptococcus pneumoniae]